MSINVGQAVGYLDLNTTGFKTGLSSALADLRVFQNETASVGDKFSAVGKAMTSVGTTLTKSVTLPTVAAGAMILKTGSDFDAAMSNVAAVTGATSEAFEDLRNSAISWGEQTKFTASEAAEALYYMGLAGWDTNESIEALGGVLNLAAAGNLELGRTSDIVTDAMTAMQISADGYTGSVKNADHFSNVLAATMSNSNTDVDQMGEAFKYVAPLAGTLGYSIEDLSLAMGLMANNGIKGSMAGTSLRNVLTNMAKPTDDQATAMEKLNISLDDGEGNMLTFKQLLDQLREGFSGIMMPEEDFIQKAAELDAALEDGTITQKEYTKQLELLTGDTYGAEEAQKLMYASMLGGARGMTGILAIANATDEEYQSLYNTLTSADAAFVSHEGTLYTLQEAYDLFGEELVNNSEEFEILGSAAGMAQKQMDNTQGSVTKLKSAFDTTKILLNDIIKDEFRGIIESLNELLLKFNNLDPAQKEFIVKIVAIAAAVGPLLIVLGSLISTLVTLAPVIGALVSPIGLVIAAIVALVAIIYTNWDELKAWVLARVHDVKAWWIRIETAVGWRAKQNIETIKSWFFNTWEAIKNFFTQKIPEFWNTIKTWFSNAVKAVKDWWNEIVQSVKDKGKECIETVAKWFDSAWESVKSFFTDTAGELWSIGADWFNSLWDGVKSVWEDISGWIGDKVSWISDKLAFWKDSKDEMSNDYSNYDDIGGFSGTNLRGNSNTTTNITNNYTFNSPKALTPSEATRQLEKLENRLYFGS